MIACRATYAILNSAGLVVGHTSDFNDLATLRACGFMTVLVTVVLS